MFLYKWRPTNYVILCHDFHNCRCCLIIFLFVGLHVWKDIRGTLPMLVLMEARGQQHWRPFSHPCLPCFLNVLLLCVCDRVWPCVCHGMYLEVKEQPSGVCSFLLLRVPGIELGSSRLCSKKFDLMRLSHLAGSPPFYLFNYFRPGLLLYLEIAIFAYPGWPVSLWYSSVSISSAADLWGHAWLLHGCWRSVCLCSKHFFHWTISPAQSLYVCM